jgi:phosphate starvation-inducible PhoH-like protein
MKRTQEAVTMERTERKQSRGRTVKDKFMEQRKERINSQPLVALNEKQKQYIEYINTKPVILSTGYPGTSKSHIPAVMACDWYLTGKIDKIVFTRPAISNSKSLGYYGGDLVSKMLNWLSSVTPVLRERLGDGVFECAIKNGDISFIPLEVIKGYSANNCMFICEEAEDITREEAKKIITRVGKNSTMVLSGDLSQSELGERSGLKWLMDIAQANPILDLGVVDFCNKSDIVRSESCKNWIIAIEKWEKSQ